MAHEHSAAADRRTFLKTALGAAAAAVGSPVMARAAAATPVRFGVDMYSLGQQNWTPFQQLDFAAKWKLQVVHFSEIRFLGSLEPAHLRQVRARADELGIDVEIGMRSICPTSAMFDRTAGTAEEQLGAMIDAARIMRSPIVRAVLGSQADRPGGIERHIDDTVKVIRSQRARLLDAGVKVAIENHAGDMQARELKTLIEGAGTDIAGVCLDSGNPVWTIEDPHLTLETLAPYVLTSHMRDSYCWNSPQGTAVQWCRMGEGNMGMEDYLRTYVQKCPRKAVSLEVIVSQSPRVFNYHDPQAWDLFKTTPAWEFARFLSLCDRGTPRPIPAQAGRRGGAAGRGGRAAGAPGGAPRRPDPAALQRNLDDVEASIRWTQTFLATL